LKNNLFIFLYWILSPPYSSLNKLYNSLPHGFVPPYFLVHCLKKIGSDFHGIRHATNTSWRWQTIGRHERKLKTKLFVIVTYSMLSSLLPGLRHLDSLPNLSYTTYLLRFIIHFDVVMSFILRWYQCRCWFTQGGIPVGISLTTQSEFPNEVQSLEDLGKKLQKMVQWVQGQKPGEIKKRQKVQAAHKFKFFLGWPRP